MNNAIEHIEISAPERDSPEACVLRAIGELRTPELPYGWSTRKNQRRYIQALALLEQIAGMRD